MSMLSNASQWLTLCETPEVTHRVNVTVRSSLVNGEAAKLKDLTIGTIRLWKQVVVAFGKGERKLEVQSPEGALGIMPYNGEPAVTVWGSINQNKKDSVPSLTVHSCLSAQAALNILWANVDACATVLEALSKANGKSHGDVKSETPPAEYDPDAKLKALGGIGARVKATSGQEGTLKSVTGRYAEVETQNGTHKYSIDNLQPAPATPKAAPAPQPTPPVQRPMAGADAGRYIGDFDSKLRFDDGEVLIFNVCQVDHKTNDKGEPFYRLVSTFNGAKSKYPSDKLVVREKNEREMQAVGGSLKALNIPIGGEMAVNWRYVVKVRHGAINAKSGKEVQYFNPVRIEAQAAQPAPAPEAF